MRCFTLTLKSVSYIIARIVDLIISKEHSFIRNIFDQDELKQSNSKVTIEKYCEVFGKMLQTVVLLNSRYTNESDTEDISDNCLAEFVEVKNIESFSELFLEIENM